MRQHARAARARRGAAARRDRRGCAGSPPRTRRASTRDEEMLAGDGVDAAGGDAARHDRHAHRHRFEDLVLRAARDVERRDHQRRAVQVRPHVGHRAGDGDAGKLAEPLHRAATDRRRRSASFSAGRRALQQRQRPGAEVEHALLVRVVVHAADEGDRVGIVGLAGRREVLAVDAVRKPVRGDAGAVALERLPFGARRRRAQVEAPREPLFGALQLARLRAGSRATAGTACSARTRATSASPCRRSRGSWACRARARRTARPTSNARRSGRSVRSRAVRRSAARAAANGSSRSTTASASAAARPSAASAPDCSTCAIS